MLSDEEWLNVVSKAPLVSIDMVFRDSQGRVLLGFRNNEPAKGIWFVPGGCIRKDELLVDAFARLSKKEIGVKVEMSEFQHLGMYEHHYTTNFALVEGISTHYICNAYTHTLKDVSLLEMDEQHSEFRWFTVEELLASDVVHENSKAYFR